MVLKLSNLTVVKVNDPKQAAHQVIRVIQDMQENQMLNTIGLATGSTMLPVYEALIGSNISFENTVAFNLDEYVGLKPGDENSYADFMHKQLFEKKPFKRTYIPNGAADNLTMECLRYEKLLNTNPIDLQLLGVGENGHIAFNEPETSFDSITHVAELTDSTIASNSRFFEQPEEVPTQAITMGIASILRAKKIVLLAFGEKKRFALEKLLEERVSKEYPVTSLLLHKDVTIITDLEI